MSDNEGHQSNLNILKSCLSTNELLKVKQRRKVNQARLKKKLAEKAAQRDSEKVSSRHL